MKAASFQQGWLTCEQIPAGRAEKELAQSEVAEGQWGPLSFLLVLLMSFTLRQVYRLP